MTITQTPPSVQGGQAPIHPLNAQTSLFWHDAQTPQPLDRDTLRKALMDFSRPAALLRRDGNFYLSAEPAFSGAAGPWEVIGYCPPFSPSNLGDPSFMEVFGLEYPLYAGAMANGISSIRMVTALGQAGFMGSFGAGGLPPARVEESIRMAREELGEKPFMFNLLNSPFEPAVEEQTAAVYLRHQVRLIEASAYLKITHGLAHYRAAGLSTDAGGGVRIANRIIAKVSRKEVALKFLEPLPPQVLAGLCEEGKITPEQARLAQMVPAADAVTVEADSGGHTDNRPLVGALPAVIRLRDEVQARRWYARLVFIGAAGGIATPESALAAFTMGAAYVVTGSINQACVESGVSPVVKELLSRAEITDTAMAPAADMFEMGVRVQVLKRGTSFSARAQKLYDLYTRYGSLEEIPPEERAALEKSVFRMALDEVWEKCVKFFSARDPGQIERAEKDPRARMALVFRWYLGLSSSWAVKGEAGREMDYQVWCGPSMGAFNEWARGTRLEALENRKTAIISMEILKGAAYLHRLKVLETFGLRFSDEVKQYRPGFD